MSNPGGHLSEEPQERRGAAGSRDTGSDEPSGGPTDRPSGTLKGDVSVPAYNDAGRPGQTGSDKTEAPPSEQPASQMPETDRDDDMVGPSHTGGTGRAEDKR